MSEKYSPKKGDRVRVVLEGEVTSTGHDRFGVGYNSAGMRNQVFPDAEHVVSIEKIEPDSVLPEGLILSEDGNLLNWLGENYVRQQVDEPVTVFKPGDTVRMLRGNASLRTLGHEGYLNHGNGTWYIYEDRYNGAFSRDEFTSESYEKVNLSS